MNNISNDGENNIINNNNITYKFVPGARRGSELLYLISEKQLYKKKVHIKELLGIVATKAQQIVKPVSL